jgi:hypothetical protein
MWAPIGGVPVPVVVVAGPAQPFAWWAPPSAANPIPVIDQGGPGPGSSAAITGPFAPSRVTPWPLHIVAASVPVTGMWWQPILTAPWPVVLITGLTPLPADLAHWRPPLADNPWPVYFV